MAKVEVFDSPMCCSTGVCGPSELLAERGDDALPAVLVDGELRSSGRYPRNTTLAAAIAVELAAQGPCRRAHDHRSTGRPSRRRADAGDITGSASLRASRIDPERATAGYVAELLADAGGALDASARAVLEEDLCSLHR